MKNTYIFYSKTLNRYGNVTLTTPICAIDNLSVEEIGIIKKEFLERSEITRYYPSDTFEISCSERMHFENFDDYREYFRIEKEKIRNKIENKILDELVQARMLTDSNKNNRY